MIYNENKIFAKVWKVTPAESGKCMDLQISTYEKDAEGNYKNSSWFPRVIGHALNSLKNVKEGDRITITKSKFSNERYEDSEGNKKSRFRFLILEASLDNQEETPKTNAPVSAVDSGQDEPW